MNNQPFDRMDKVNSLLLLELATLLQQERIEQQDISSDIVLSFTKIQTSRDLKHAKVYFTVFPVKYRGDAKKFLQGKAYEWQKSLGEKITLKYIPKLAFFYDEGQANALEVEKILSQLKN
jgi:ribosome-binding factor A